MSVCRFISYVKSRCRAYWQGNQGETGIYYLNIERKKFYMKIIKKAYKYKIIGY